MPSSRYCSICTLLTLLVLLGMAAQTQGQSIYKYGAEFLAGGVGARALGMGGTYIAVSDDVTSGYWNPAGLSALDYPQGAFMHAGRFANTVVYDYAAAAYPINDRSTVALSLVRLGVDDIPNTLDAWDAERDQPLPRAEDFITRFSYAHYALFISYARQLSEGLSIGVSGKIINGSIGDFADSWGYSFDVGARYRTGGVTLGVTLQDVSTMLQSWSVNDAEVEKIGTNFGLPVPEGGTELVLPVARFGAAYTHAFGDFTTTAAADLDAMFDGLSTYAFDMDGVSFHPRLGGEVTYRDVVALRAGLSDVYNSERYGWNASPSVGAGLKLNQVALDYAFGNFAGFASELGASHRISIKLTLEQPSLARDR